MDNQDYYAFLTSKLESDNELSEEQKCQLQDEVDEYYGNLAHFESEQEVEVETDSAYQEYAEEYQTETAYSEEYADNCLDLNYSY